MRLRTVGLDKRKQAFEIGLDDERIVSFPFSRSRPRPTRDDPVLKAFVEPSSDGELISYVLASGDWGHLHRGEVLDYLRDPDYARNQILYGLTLEARSRMAETGMGVRELGRRLETSPAQIYRLLDPSNYRKSLDQLVRLLTAMGFDVAVQVRPRPRTQRG